MSAKSGMQNLCLNKAKNKSIHTARLPIGTYLSDMKTSKVGLFFCIGMILSVNKVQILTVNQVFDILLQWIATRDWEGALRAVMPKRKMLPSQTSKGTSPVDVEGILELA